MHKGFNLRAWTLNGMPLARPDQIIRRAIAFPVIKTLHVLVFIVTLFGWGLDEATRNWNQ